MNLVSELAEGAVEAEVATLTSDELAEHLVLEGLYAAVRTATPGGAEMPGRPPTSVRPALATLAAYGWQPADLEREPRLLRGMANAGDITAVAHKRVRDLADDRKPPPAAPPVRPPTPPPCKRAPCASRHPHGPRLVEADDGSYAGPCPVCNVKTETRATA